MSIHRANIITRPSGRSTLMASAGAIAALCVAGTGRAQFEITASSGNTSQDFDGTVIEGPVSNGTGPNVWSNDTTLTPGDSTFNGWSLFTYTNQPITSYGALGGATTSGGFYSFGSTSATERALGGIGSESTYFGSPVPASGAVAGYIAFAATNHSGTNLGSFTLGFDGEQWRNGGNVNIQSMVFEFGFGETFDSVPSGSWQAPGDDFDWGSPIVGATASAVEGNGPGLIQDRGGTVSGLTWINGQTLWLRWIERNDGGNDHGLAIDNFSLSWQAGPPPKNLTWAASNNTWDTAQINWVDGTPNAFGAGDLVNFTNSGLTQNSVVVAGGGVISGLVTFSHTAGTYTLTGGPITAFQPLQKTGGGTLVLGTSFSQGLNAQGGVVRLAAGGGFGNTSSVTLGAGTTFSLNGNNEVVGALTAAAATVSTGGANLTVNGPATLASTTVTAGAGVFTINGIASLTGATISTTGAGLVAINGNINVSTDVANVPTTISGRLSTGSTGRTYTIAGGNTGVDFDLDAGLEGAGRITFTGSGKVRLGGDNSAQTGGFRLNSGLTYLVESPMAFGNTQLFLNGGTIDAGIALTGANKITTAVSLGGSLVAFVGESLEFGGAVSFFDTMNKVLLIEDGQTVTLSGSLHSGGTPLPNSRITKTGLGTLVLRANASLYHGDLSVEDGELVAVTAGALGSGDVTVGFGVDTDPAATLTIHASQTIASLTIGDNGVVVLTAAAPAEAAVPAASPVAVPEPGSAALLLCGALGLLRFRRGRA